MEVITWKKPAIRLNLLHLLSILFSVVMVFAFSAYAQTSEGGESAPSVVTSSADSSSGGDTSESSNTAGDSGVSSSDSASNSKNSGGEEAGGPDGSSNDSAQVSEGDDTCADSSSGGDTSESSNTAGDSGVSSSDSASNSENSGGEEAGGPDGSSNDSAQVSEGDDTCDDSSSPGNNSDDISPQQNSDGNTETPGSEEKGSEDEAGFVDGVEDPVDSIDSAAVTTEDSVTSADSDEDLSLMTMGLSSQEDPSTGTPADEEVTLPEYQIPSGSAYIVGSEDTVYYNTATQNAIQQAVEAAKAAAASQVTIVVSNGVYAGGIKLIIPAPVGETGDGSPEPAGKMLLQIIAEDAYTTDEDGNITPNANSAGGVDVEGDLDFDGINLLLAGLYLSLRSTINAKNADTVTYFGTSQDDEVKINLDNVSDSIFIDSGGGDDVLDISVSQSPYRQAARV
ncbi:MAG: hypothetical protein ACOX0N_03360 [Syntrophomonadaceae bacterium]|jgi:hypothetical protein